MNLRPGRLGGNACLWGVSHVLMLNIRYSIYANDIYDIGNGTLQPAPVLGVSYQRSSLEQGGGQTIRPRRGQRVEAGGVMYTGL